jgi:hypothetical protein
MTRDIPAAGQHEASRRAELVLAEMARMDTERADGRMKELIAGGVEE